MNGKNEKQSGKDWKNIFGDDGAAGQTEEEFAASAEEDNAVTYDDVEPIRVEQDADAIKAKIRAIHANAMNSYAKSDETEESEEPEEIEEDGVIADEVLEEDTDDFAEEEGAESADNGVPERDAMKKLLNVLKDGEKSGKSSSSQNDNVKKTRIMDMIKPKDATTTNTAETPIVQEEENRYPFSAEYDSPVQKNTFFAKFRADVIKHAIFLLLSLISTALCCWIEIGHAAGLPFEAYMQSGPYGKVFVMTAIELLMISVALNFDGLIRGFSKLSVKRPAPESVPVLVTAVVFLHAVFSYFVAYQSYVLRTYCFLGCFALAVLSVNTFIKSYTRFASFALAVSPSVKLSTVRLGNLAAEYTAFAKYMNEDCYAASVTRTAEASDFVKHSHDVPKVFVRSGIVSYVMLAVSLLFTLVLTFVFGKDVYSSVTSGVTAFLFAAPISFLATSAFPFFAAFLRAGKLHGTFVGEAACDNYENCGAISFDDTEVFPPKAVKVSNIKPYGTVPLDRTIVNMARIFKKIGGPLNYIFASSVDEPVSSSDVTLIETSADGIHVKVEEKDILVGRSSYLHLFGIDVPVDDADENEMRSLTSILWYVQDGELCAKFYIRYTLNRFFEPLLKKFYEAGICIGIHTTDPGIDDALITNCLKNSRYPIRVIRKDTKEISRVAETADGCLFSASSIHNYLKCFLMADSLRGKYKTNLILSCVGAFIGLVLASALIFTGIASGMSAIVILFYQLFWLLPPLVLALFSR